MYYNLNEHFGRERGGVKMNRSVTMLIQDKSSYLISFNILITCLLYNILEFWGENTC